MLYNYDNLYIIEILSKERVTCQIVLAKKNNLPKKKDGWKFNWSNSLKESPNSTYALIENNSSVVHGMLQIKYDEGMLIMELIELAPFNIGSNKMYDRIAGCLISFACRESFKLKNNYTGYVTFVSKTKLMEWYRDKYYASQSIGQRMYIDPFSGQKLIDKYLKT